MRKHPKIREQEKKVASLERQLERCPAGNSEKVIKLSLAWEKAQERLQGLEERLSA